MTNRREFLQIGVTAGAWPLVSRAAHAAGLGHAMWAPLAIVVYDTRFPDSVAFGERARTRGFHTRAIEADMTRLWYDEIYHQWQREPAAIAGLTAYGPMFCFAELARDVRMRLVFRGEHRPGSVAGRAPFAEHHFSGPTSMLSEAVAGCSGTGEFGASMADVVARCPVGRTEIGRQRLGRSEGVSQDDALFTWVIAPAIPG